MGHFTQQTIFYLFFKLSFWKYNYTFLNNTLYLQDLLFSYHIKEAYHHLSVVNKKCIPRSELFATVEDFYCVSWIYFIRVHVFVAINNPSHNLQIVVYFLQKVLCGFALQMVSISSSLQSNTARSQNLPSGVSKHMTF